MRLSTLMLIAVVAVVLAGSGACIPRAEEDGAPCPCNEGWSCCPSTNSCIRKGAECPGCTLAEDGSVMAHASTACSGGDVLWFDSCGEPGDLQSSCCGMGCADGVCNPPQQHASFGCDAGDVYWFDSCGLRQDVKETCVISGCTDGACVPEVWYGIGGSGSGAGVASGTDQVEYPAIALDASGNPTVAWADRPTEAAEVYLRRWNGSAWEELGSSATEGGVSSNHHYAALVRVTLDPEGNPWLAWADGSPYGFDVYLRHWDGSTWTEVSSGTGLEPLSGSWTALASNTDEQGRTVAAWVNAPSSSVARVERWDSTTWEDLGSAFAATSSPTVISLAISANGSPTVSWSADGEIYLQQWTGSSLQGLGGSESGGGLSNTYGGSDWPVVALDGSGYPAVAWTEVVGSEVAVHLRRWNGTSWTELGGSASSGGVSGVSSSSSGWGVLVEGLVFDASDRPIVVWGSYRATDGCPVFLRRWDGAAWVEIGGSASGDGVGVIPGSGAKEVALAPPRAGRLCLAWNGPSGAAILVRCTNLP